MKVLWASIMVVGMLAQSTGYGCSAFLYAVGDTRFVGKSYDWFFDLSHGAAFVNQRGVAKDAFALDLSQNPLKGVPMSWTSRYMSTTFNQFGREFPMGGMNEAGLVIEILQLPESKTPDKSDARPYVNESQWIQYALDSYATVEEVVAGFNDVRIATVFVGAHYFVCDQASACAVVEFLDGKAVVHQQADGSLPIPAITNNVYEDSMNYFAKNKNRDIPGSGSLPRFNRVARAIASLNADSESTLDSALWDVLDSVDYKSDYLTTAWNIQYAPKVGDITFRTKLFKSKKHLAMGNLNADCGQAVQMLDMNQDLPSEVSDRFDTYSVEANKALVMQNSDLISEELLAEVAAYPETNTRCAK